ncbi:MAG: GNAT family N-acetyltransferase [Gordonia sp. (in: high G+C Gram-positive bacteria)]|uniref:GNAT family N-acetyltransferase n=1 Tax=Gordonia sp. (in: high G+C Gram-positive bacteria) TaxID=84139 RepID=UPI0039E4E79F
MIRAATADDLPAITELYAHYVENTTATWALETPDLAAWQEKFSTLAEDGLPFLVVVDDETLQGFAYLADFRGRGGWRRTVEDTVYLREDATGRGYGTRLLGALLDAADPERVRVVVAMISAERAGSITLHRKLGFVETGRLPGVSEKSGQVLDCVVMQRPLIL